MRSARRQFAAIRPAIVRLGRGGWVPKAPRGNKAFGRFRDDRGGREEGIERAALCGRNGNGNDPGLHEIGFGDRAPGERPGRLRREHVQPLGGPLGKPGPQIAERGPNVATSKPLRPGAARTVKGSIASRASAWTKPSASPFCGCFGLSHANSIRRPHSWPERDRGAKRRQHHIVVDGPAALPEWRPSMPKALIIHARSRRPNSGVGSVAWKSLRAQNCR